MIQELGLVSESLTMLNPLCTHAVEPKPLSEVLLEELGCSCARGCGKQGVCMGREVGAGFMCKLRPGAPGRGKIIATHSVFCVSG